MATEATGLQGIDDFTFTGRGGQLLATLNGTSQVALVKPGGGHSIVLTPADGLQNPTSVAVRGNTAYVTSAAYLTAEDPNLIRLRLESRAARAPAGPAPISGASSPDSRRRSCPDGPSAYSGSAAPLLVAEPDWATGDDADHDRAPGA
ncbi:hypothetical protein ACF08B_02180 [Streptomyces sp. NPDC015139]|uniref:hypothetical protein n=1 Tax=Streptomyces sp. NPDC015139 TaxID=3364942 RepID=UPI0036F65250